MDKPRTLFSNRLDWDLYGNSLLAAITLFPFYQQMQNRMVVLLCNLKPAKMRGIVSQAMVMCASTPEKVEILDPPSGAEPGERITFQGFPGAKRSHNYTSLSSLTFFRPFGWCNEIKPYISIHSLYFSWHQDIQVWEMSQNLHFTAY